MSETESKAILDIASERRRQVEVEGFSPAHDDMYNRGELVRAAVNYAAAASVGIYLSSTHDNINPPPFRNHGQAVRWPWSYDRWKSTTPRRDLVKAAALLVAEIERLDRAEGGAA
ncbi:hypothetical protein [Rhizobium leguminosarum]